MSLIAWYPLHGNIKDYSGYNRHLSGSYNEDINGKIGKCHKRMTNNLSIPLSCKDIGNEFTIAFWIYTDSTSGTSSHLFGPDSLRSAITYFQYPEKNDFHWSSCIETATENSNFIGGVDYGVLKNDTWTHVVVTYKNKQMIRYYNGIPTTPWVASSELYMSGTGAIPIIGLDKTKFNDLRIYNHALSLKEVQEIAKCKIMHFSMNHGVNKNIVKNYDLKTGWSTGYCKDIKWNDIKPPRGVNSQVVSFIDNATSETDDKSGFWYSYGDYTDLQVTNQWYTASLYVKTNDSNFRIKAYTADNSEVGRVNTEYITVPNDGQWHRVVWNPIIPPDGSVSESLSFHFTFGNATGEGQRTWFCAPKMEEGSQATAFVPYADNQLIVKDESGFQYDLSCDYATRGRWHTDSATGSNSFYFENVYKKGQYYRNAMSKQDIRIPEQGTISFYYRQHGMENGDNKYAVGWQNFCSMNNEGLLGLIYYYDGSNYTTANIGHTYDNEVWHMYTITWDSTAKKVSLYFNGEKIVDNKDTQTMIHAGTYRRFVIGSAWATTYGGVSGFLDDIRVYATRLTDSDIKALYQTKASLTKEGVFFSNELKEIASDSKTIKIASSGYGQGSSPVMLDDVLLHQTGRSWSITQLDEKLKHIGSWNYDVYGDVANANVFLTKFREIPKTHTIIVNTYDEPFNNAQTIRDELEKYGASIKSYPIASRHAYYCILKKTGSNAVIAERFDANTTGEQVIKLYYNAVGAINKKSQIVSSNFKELDLRGLETKKAYDATWAKIYYHNSKSGTVLWTSYKEFLSTNQTDKKSWLYRLEGFKGTDGKFELLMECGGVDGYNRWKQSNNFTVDSRVSDYEAIACSWTANGWTGLEGTPLASSTFADGNSGTGTWWYSIGPKVNYNNGMPCPHVVNASTCTLWVRIDNLQAQAKIHKDGTISSSNFIEN